MRWEDGNVHVSHLRAPWGPDGDEWTLVHSRLDQVNGNFKDYGDLKKDYYRTYLAAKHQFDIKSAYEIIDRCIKPETMDIMARFVAQLERRPILIFPHPSFDDEDGIDGKTAIGRLPSNAIPFAFAEYLSRRLGCKVNETIIQSARPGRSKLTMWMRFLCQPKFDGNVDVTSPYIVIDDVITTGGTFAALRGYIIQNGGTVAGTAALAHKNGVHQKFAIADQTLGVLKSLYGAGLDSYWTGTFGHAPSTLTETESEFWAFHARTEWASVSRGAELLHCLRERINRAAATGG
jgi:hypothetical protein